MFRLHVFVRFCVFGVLHVTRGLLKQFMLGGFWDAFMKPIVYDLVRFLCVLPALQDARVLWCKRTFSSHSLVLGEKSSVIVLQ